MCGKTWKEYCSLLYDKYVDKFMHDYWFIWYHPVVSFNLWLLTGHNSYHCAVPCPHDIFLLDRMDIPMGLRFGTQENLSRLNRFFMRKEDLQAMISGRFRVINGDDPHGWWDPRGTVTLGRFWHWKKLLFFFFLVLWEHVYHLLVEK